MKKSPFVLSLFLLLSIFASAQSASKLHYKAVLVDTHNDILSSAMLEGKDISHRIKEGHSDLDRWKEGGVDVQFFSVWTDKKPRTEKGFYADAVHEISLLDTLVQKNPDRMVLAKNYKEVKKGVRQGKLVALIGLEGGHMIENDINKLEKIFEQGAGYMTLTWNNSTDWATSAMDETATLNLPLQERLLKH